MKKIAYLSPLAFAPLFAFAQGTPDLGGIESLVNALGDIVNLLIPIAVAVAVLLFFWGLATFIFASGDSEAQATGKQKMIWGVIALFVIVSIWGIVGFLGNLLGIDQGGTAPVPGVAGTAGEGGIDPTNQLGS